MGANDDFISPRDTDTFTRCDANSDIISNSVILPLGGALSLLCYVYLMWMYFVVKSPVLMRHPTTLAIYKCIFDIIFVQQYLWLPFVATNEFYSDDVVNPPFYCQSTISTGLLAFLTQFSLLGSELCFLVISVDLRLGYTNPFLSFKQTRWYFASFVLGFALLSAFALISMGNSVYGLASEGVVWIQDRREVGSADYPKLILFYFIVGFIYLYCLWANFQYYRSSEKGFSQTVSNRYSIMQRSKRFTLAYIMYDTVTLGLEFISFLNGNYSQVINSLPAYFYCCRGICALIIILFSNSAELTWANLNPFQRKRAVEVDEMIEGLLVQPHLNAVLRVEILYFTTHAIMHAAREFHRRTWSTSASITGLPLQEDSGLDRTYSFDDRTSMRDLADNQSFDGRKSTGVGLMEKMRQSLFQSAAKPMSAIEFAEAGHSDVQRPSMVVLERLHLCQATAVSRAVEDSLRPSFQRCQPSIWLQPDNANDTTTSPVHDMASNRSTDSTLKWRDTADVEFGVKESQDRSSKHDSPLSWHRIRGKSRTADPSKSADSDSSVDSAVGRLRKVLSEALNNASLAAKSMLSPAYKEFLFMDYCPKLFAKVRSMVNISAEDYSRAFESTCRERFSEGRSGAFMFFSSDEKFIVKTTTREELLTLHRLMPSYVEYLERHPQSLIVRFLGAHCITMYGVQLYFVVMLNLFPTTLLSERYDLKGSWVNRYGFKGAARRANDRRDEGKECTAPLFQDNDLQQKISLDRRVAEALALQIHEDVKFLRDNGRMDYSLLIGVKRERFRVTTGGAAVAVDDTDLASIYEEASDLSDISRVLVEQRDANGGYRALIVDGPGSYYVGIIDILQSWNWPKYLERLFKIYVQRLDGEGISAMPPDPYAERFFSRCVVDTFEGLAEFQGRSESRAAVFSAQPKMRNL